MKHGHPPMSNRRVPAIAALWPWFAAAIAGVMLGLCFPKWNIGSLIWIWQLPLLAALWFTKPSSKPRTRWRKSSKPKKPRARWQHGFALGYLCGLCFFVINVSWLYALRRTVDSVGAGLAAWFLVAAYLALYFGLFGAFAATVGRWRRESVTTEYARKRKLPGWLAPSLHTLRIAFLNAGAWCGLEWLRGVFLTGFGWNGLAVALHDNLAMVQAAELVGVTGLAFPLVFASCVGLATLARFAGEIRDRSTLRPHLDFAVAMALVIAMFLFGLNRLTADRAETETVQVRSVIIQLNIPIDKKWDAANVRATLERYYELTQLYIDSGEFDLVFWPETAIPGRFTYPWVQDYFTRVLDGGKFHLLTGMEHEDPILSEDPDAGDVLLYNTLTIMRGTVDSYQAHTKVHLVPFGEYLPFRHSFPPMEWIAGTFVPGDFEFGTSRQPMRISDPDLQIIPLICFEDTVGRVARSFIHPDDEQAAPQLLVTVTNNGWFWDSANAPQHLANARFRCIELRRPMVRSANTGISCVINEYGGFTDPDDPSGFERIIQDERTGNPHITGALPATLSIPKNPQLTLYARYGDTFSVSLGLIALVTAVTYTIRARKRKDSQV